MTLLNFNEEQPDYFKVEENVLKNMVTRSETCIKTQGAIITVIGKESPWPKKNLLIWSDMIKVMLAMFLTGNS